MKLVYTVELSEEIYEIEDLHYLIDSLLNTELSSDILHSTLETEDERSEH